MQKYFFTYFTIILFLLSFTNSHSQQAVSDTLKIKQYSETANQIVQSALNENQGYNFLRELCIIGPRLSGSENSLKAIKWAKNKLEKIGADSVWLQSTMVPHWVRGNIEEAYSIGSNGKRKLNILALGGSVGTPDNGITTEVVEVKSFEELEAKNVKDKIVFYNRPLDKGMIETFSAYGKAVDQRVYGAINAAKFGAVGVLVRSVTTEDDNVPHTGVMLYVDSLQKIPAAALGVQDAEYLSQQLKLNPNLKVQLNLNCKTLPDAQSYNVIGEIKGSEYPDEVIVISGHIDSWDVGCGAHDDGAGCVQSIETLDLLRRLNIKPKRTIRCVLFINEENGSRGAKRYGEFADSSNEKHIAAIESDRGGFTPIGFTYETNSKNIEEKIKSWLPILEKSEIWWVKPGGTGADISKIKDTELLLGYVPDPQRYFDFHHSPKDVFDAVHPRELELGTAAITTMVYLISEEGF